MHVTHLSLTDFRNYESLELEFQTGVTALIGPNGQGKTNIVEALGYVATLGSHRVAHDAPLVRRGATRAVVRTALSRQERKALVELEIIPGGANRAKINRAPAVRTRDVLGWMRTVLFAPEDLALVKGDPETRRRFLDEVVIARSPRMAGVKADYDKILKQRNALLKSMSAQRRRGPSDEYAGSTLDIWDDQLATAGSELIQARLKLIHDLRQPTHAAHETISAGSGGECSLDYRSSVLNLDDLLAPADAQVPSREAVRDIFLASLAGLRSQEIERGVTLCGPQRDDVLIGLNAFPAKGYASHGESWSLALALRLACYDLLTADAGEFGDGEPVLILDDVFAELDSGRRERLTQQVAVAQQVIVTSAVAEDVPEVLQARRYFVNQGKVQIP